MVPWRAVARHGRGRGRETERQQNSNGISASARPQVLNSLAATSLGLAVSAATGTVKAANSVAPVIRAP